MRTIAVMLNASTGKINQAIDRWLPRFGLIGRLLTSLPHSEKVARNLMPAKIKELGFGNVFCIMDCRDTICDTIRVGDSRGQYSSKVGGSAIRQLFSQLFYGGYHYVSEPCFARISEMAVVFHNREQFEGFPKTMEVAVDKGFDTLASLLPDHQYVHIPAFAMKNKPQFTERQINEAQDMARMRYLVEVGISRPSSFERYDHVVHRHDFQNYDNIAFLCVGMSVLQRPLLVPELTPDATTILAAYCQARCLGGEPIRQ